MLQTESLGARRQARKVMFLLTDGQVTSRFLPNYAPAIRRLQNSNIVRIGNLFLRMLFFQTKTNQLVQGVLNECFKYYHKLTFKCDDAQFGTE